MKKGFRGPQHLIKDSCCWSRTYVLYKLSLVPMHLGGGIVPYPTLLHVEYTLALHLLEPDSSTWRLRLWCGFDSKILTGIVLALRRSRRFRVLVTRGVIHCCSSVKSWVITRRSLVAGIVISCFCRLWLRTRPRGFWGISGISSLPILPQKLYALARTTP